MTTAYRRVDACDSAMKASELNAPEHHSITHPYIAASETKDETGFLAVGINEVDEGANELRHNNVEQQSTRHPNELGGKENIARKKVGTPPITMQNTHAGQNVISKDEGLASHHEPFEAQGTEPSWTGPGG